MQSTLEQISLSHMSQLGFKGQMIQNGFPDDPVYLEKKSDQGASDRDLAVFTSYAYGCRCNGNFTVV